MTDWDVLSKVMNIKELGLCGMTMYLVLAIMSNINIICYLNYHLLLYRMPMGMSRG